MTNSNAPVLNARKKKNEPAVEAPEFPARAIQEAILGLNQAMKELNSTRLTENALVILLSESSKVPRQSIREVLRSLKTLEETYLKPVREKRSR